MSDSPTPPDPESAEDLMASSLQALLDAEEEALPRSRKAGITLYDTHIAPRLDEIRKWLHMGTPNYRVAELLGISVLTLRYWRAKNKDFARLFRRSRKVANRMVENALYDRAVGSESIERTYERDDEGVLRLERVKRSTILPDVGAAKYILGNRNPERWREPSLQVSAIVSTAKTLAELVSTVPCIAAAQKQLEGPEDDIVDVESEEVEEEE